MSKLQAVKGSTSIILQVFIQDKTSTTGAGLTGLVFNTATITAYYHRDTDTTATAISLVTMTVGTFTSSGFKEIDATNMPGWYQICPPNAALASGAKSVGIHLKGGGNMADLPLEVELTAVDNQSATAFMTSVASVVGAVGSVTGLTAANLDTTISSRMATYTQPTGFLAATFPAGTVANTTNITAGTVTTATNLTNAPTAGDFTATMKTSIGTAVAASAVASVTARVTANTDQLAGQTVTAAAGVTFPTSVASPTNITAGTITTATNLTNAPTAGDFTATMKTSIGTAVAASAVATVTDLSSTAQVELSAVPASTATVKDMIKWLYLLSRNKLTQTATTTLVKANDGSTTVGTSTVSDDATTAIRGVFS